MLRIIDKTVKGETFVFQRLVREFLIGFFPAKENQTIAE
jgi:hypothetical protein